MVYKLETTLRLSPFDWSLVHGNAQKLFIHNLLNIGTELCLEHKYGVKGNQDEVEFLKPNNRLTFKKRNTVDLICQRNT